MGRAGVDITVSRAAANVAVRRSVLSLDRWHMLAAWWLP